MRQQKPSHYTRNSYTVLGLYPMLILSDETIPCCDCDPKKWGHHGHHGHFLGQTYQFPLVISYIPVEIVDLRS